MLVRLLIAMTALLSACGPIDPGPPVNEEGEVIPMPPPFDDWLVVESVTPDGGEVGPRPTLQIQFDTWLDDDELVDFRIGQLSSAGLAYSGRVKWKMTTRTLEFTPFSELETGLTYRLRIDGVGLRSVTGAPFQSRDLPQFVAVEGGEEFAAEPEPNATWLEVDTLFEAKCRSCHSDPQWQLNPLTREALIGARSAQRDQLLVVPFDPSDSYLMHKIIPDYPVRANTVQPPPWANLEPLSTAEVFLVERWIAQGARP